MMAVKNEFEKAFHTLHNAPKRLRDEFDEDQLRSYCGPMLKMIIDIDPRQIQERNWLRSIHYIHPTILPGDVSSCDIFILYFINCNLHNFFRPTKMA